MPNMSKLRDTVLRYVTLQLSYYIFCQGIFFFPKCNMFFGFCQEWCERLIEMQDIIDAWLKVCDLEYP